MEPKALDLGRLNHKLDGQNHDLWLHLQADTKLDKYPAKQHVRAVATKLGVDEGLIFLAGEKTTLLTDSDQPVPFRQRRYFYYLTGCNEPDCYVLYDIAKDLLTLYIPRVDLKHAVWGGAGSTKAEAFAKYDVDNVEYTDNVLANVVQLYAQQNYAGRLYVLSDVEGRTTIVASRLAVEMFMLDEVQRDVNKKQTIEKKVDTTKLKSAIDSCRVIKFPHEVELIRRANDISAKAHRAVLENVKHFKNEREVEGRFLDTCISSGAHSQAYSIIAGAGPNAAVLHYVANDAPFDDKQVLLLDAGAEYSCYASDVTRTVPISGYWTEEAKNIYDAVNDMQAQCMARIRPGVHFRDLQILASAIATRWLLKIGVLHNGSLAEILKAGTIRAFFPHGLGHHVGLDVHDVLNVPIQSKGAVTEVESDLSVYRDTELDGLPRETISQLYKTLIERNSCKPPVTSDSPVLEPGMVVTVEPGIYFSDFALSRVYLLDPVHSKYINVKVLEKYMPVGGVRIEDDILVTKDGYENLTTAPKGDDALKIIRGEAETEYHSRFGHDIPSILEPPVPPAATSDNKGKMPLGSSTISLREKPGMKDTSRNWSKQPNQKAFALTSTNADPKLDDDLPPINEDHSLICSFPFAKTTSVSITEKPACSTTSSPEHCQRIDLIKQIIESQERTKKIIDDFISLCTTKNDTNIVPDEISKLERDLENSTLALQASQNATLSQSKNVLAGLLEGESSSKQSAPESASSRLEQTQAEQIGSASVMTRSDSPELRSSSPRKSQFARVLYDFHDAYDEVCVVFKEGDIVEILSENRNGWRSTRNTRTGQRGWLPSNYVSKEETARLRKGPPTLLPADEKPDQNTNLSESSDDERAAANQIRGIMAEQCLRSVFTKELAVLMEATDAAHTSATHKIEELIRSIVEEKEDGDKLTCFAGLCMQLRAVLPSIRLNVLPGSGMDKFRRLYNKIDETLKNEFAYGHLFYRVDAVTRTALLANRWKSIRIKEEAAVGEIGVCGTCRVCRVGFVGWDERWLADSVDEDADDE
ncbi:hypothetical protein, variant [Verruconis gallopava]|uniref:Xaa-Pro aminopeptidase n=1 Tax=Verruconis gallopava TaxID=253628 RepID=A0A0D2AD22_9PEZI|nr:hypothetical protein, variant [Verruconis gallopava]KIW04828.1 hypothetical protein, variant [Verruconis gallopava]